MEKQPAEPRNTSNSAAASLRTESCISQSIVSAQQSKKYRFQSYLLDSEYERPWINDPRLNRTRLGNYIIWGFVAVSLVLSAYYNYAETKLVPKYEVGTTPRGAGATSNAHLNI